MSSNIMMKKSNKNHEVLKAYIEIKRIMKEFHLSTEMLESIKNNNRYCKGKKCYLCDYWNECFYNMERSTIQ